MKRWILLLLCLILSVSAFSEGAPADLFACDCGCVQGETCACFLQEGDKGLAVNSVIEHLKERGYLPFSHSRGVFDREVTEAVMRFQREMDLDETGVLDNETLTYLLLYGVFTDFFQMEQEESRLVWVPTDGGKRYHTRKTCSSMLSPRKISERNASAMGIELCGHCKKRGTRP